MQVEFIVLAVALLICVATLTVKVNFVLNRIDVRNADFNARFNARNARWDRHSKDIAVLEKTMDELNIKITNGRR